MGVFDLQRVANDREPQSTEKIAKVTDPSGRREYVAAQVSIPQAVRREAGIMPGDRLYFSLTDDGRAIEMRKVTDSDLLGQDG